MLFSQSKWKFRIDLRLKSDGEIRFDVVKNRPNNIIGKSIKDTKMNTWICQMRVV